MSYTPDASKEYLRSAVLTASSEQLHVMLLDGAVRFAMRGLEAINAQKTEDMFNSLERAQRIVLELSNGLRREVNPTLVDRMAALYGFIYRRLVDANMQRDPQAVVEAVRILRHQRETWTLLIEKVKKETSSLAAPSPSADAPGDQGGRSRFVAEG